ncbi:hypothetical protein EDB19DRAFT_1833594 [Suillus lakei]|nr:hypothetical protein EDB19DRAFT_1833594 [Suillus lakei]
MISSAECWVPTSSVSKPTPATSLPPVVTYVNPWDVVAAMKRGLVMSEQEHMSGHAVLHISGHAVLHMSGHAVLHKVVATHTSHTWAAVLAKMLLLQIYKIPYVKPHTSRARLKELYDHAWKRLFLFLFDYDVRDAHANCQDAINGACIPDELTALVTLASDPNGIVYIVFGRNKVFLEEHLGHFPHLGMGTEHDGFIHSPDSVVWMNFTASLDMEWMEEVAEIVIDVATLTGAMNIVLGGIYTGVPRIAEESEYDRFWRMPQRYVNRAHQMGAPGGVSFWGTHSSLYKGSIEYLNLVLALTPTAVSISAQVLGSKEPTDEWQGLYASPCDANATVHISFGGTNWTIRHELGLLNDTMIGNANTTSRMRVGGDWLDTLGYQYLRELEWEWKLDQR